MDELVTLPGVGRKTANVILGNAFDIPGITVDTHFGRLVRRWRWTAEEDPVKVEHAIGELIERSEWTLLSHRVIFHGRRVCHARKPACGVCVLAKDCPSFGIGPTDPLIAAPLVKGPGDRAPAGAGRALSQRPRTHEHVDPMDHRGVGRRRRAGRRAVDAARATTGSPPGSTGPGQARDRRDADTAEALAGPRARADLPPCPGAGDRSRPRGTARHHARVRRRRLERRRRRGRRGPHRRC